jgi:hypothetical protein
MAHIGLVALGAAHIDKKSGLPLIQACNIHGDTEETENFGELPLYQCLGVTAMPSEPTEDNEDYAEGVMAFIDGRWVILGGRDPRTAKIVGNMQGGDTVVHSTGPNQAAQLQLKEKKRQAALVSKDTTGTTMVFLMDGKNDKVQLAAFGHIFEMSKNNGICLVEKTGAAGIQIKDGLVSIFGTVVLGGRTPLAPVLGGLTGPAAAPAKGVFIGA